MAEDAARLQLAHSCALQPCSYLACTDLRGASEGELVKGRHCSGCKVATYCGVGCQRAAWSQHKLVCAKLQPGEGR